MTSDIAELVNVILRLHGATAEHLESVPVKETLQGETVWEGIVEVFRLPLHPAGKAYAWSHESDSGGRRYVAVLHHPPIDTPLKAVQAAIAAEYHAQNSR